MLTLTAPALPAIILSAATFLSRFAIVSFRRVAQHQRTLRTLARMPQPGALRSAATTAAVGVASVALVVVSALITSSIIGN